MDGQLVLHGDIGDGGDITSKQVLADLRKMGPVDTLTVSIFSSGGDYFEALAIYSAIMQHDAQKVVVEIGSLAASGASIIAMAGHEIKMAPAALMMLHLPSSMILSNAAGIRQEADQLDQIAGNMANLYSARSGMSADDALSIMQSECWLDAVTAIDYGFADALL